MKEKVLAYLVLISICFIIGGLFQGILSFYYEGGLARILVILMPLLLGTIMLLLLKKYKSEKWWYNILLVIAALLLTSSFSFWYTNSWAKYTSNTSIVHINKPPAKLSTNCFFASSTEIIINKDAPDFAIYNDGEKNIPVDKDFRFPLFNFRGGLKVLYIAEYDELIVSCRERRAIHFTILEE